MNIELVQKTAGPMAQPGVAAAVIEAWLIDRIATLSGVGPEDIDVTLPFSYYALDSVVTVGLTAELEDLLRVSLPATLLWDYPTIASLAGQLARREAPES